MGHSELECPTPAERNDEGKLPYDVQLRAPEERRRRVQSFASAAAESFGKGSSSTSRPPRPNSRSDGRGSLSGSRHSDNVAGDSEEPEVQSPLKEKQQEDSPSGKGGAVGASRSLDLQEDQRAQAHKRKATVSSPVTQTPDLNIPLGVSSALVPAGLVNSRVSQLDPGMEGGGGNLNETLKKQKRGNTSNSRSAAAAKDSPRRAQ